MQTTGELPQENQTAPHEEGECRESFYRTKWLAAHNRLHALAHGEANPDWWNEYLEELEFADMDARLIA